MRKLLLLFVLCVSSMITKAQQAPAAKTANTAFIVEVGGIGGPYSFTLDKRLTKNRIDGIGLRAGFSGLATSEEKIFSVPVQVNWLFGKNKSYFEVGAGATFFHYDGYEYVDGGTYVCNQTSCGYVGGKRYAGHFLVPISNRNSVLGTLNFGYRRMPAGEGFMWKASLTPIFNENGFWPIFAGFGIGYKF